ncbi:neuronal pentraxin-2-like [Ctenopharyngodon idella]|uniref:neuronal pentraxin-2-like n=1 Tax=Ctenopharyngodon idella TaxID=7959 RepID=UPI002231A832|nr:neuronal pentraxin-2-like [Ctenopharyngodon idella]
MVAFIGAVICIIAAVHSGSPPASAAAAQPLADNQSLSPGATGKAFSSGSVARAGPLDALHGTDATSRERGGPEAPTFYGLTGLGTGGSEQQVTYSRLICTPVPAGECNPKNFEQQADDQSLYAGEDWGYLRTTAEELRQTVLQQKDEILTDQRTIRELTGKLSECESGLKGRKVPERSAGLGDARKKNKEQLMMRDDAGSSMRTAHAVEELVHAITQMKDRIEKLESEMAPPAFNHTDTSSQKAAGTASSTARTPVAAAQRRVEDLEGELKRKIKLLEEERKALRKETQKHQEHIDYGLDTVHQRISSLEKGLSENKFPEGYRLSFPVRSTSMYAIIKQEIPVLHTLTVCMWLKPAKSILGTTVSYAVSDQSHEFVLQQLVHGPIELIINNEVAQLPLNLTVGRWQHMCVSWNRRAGAWHAYLGGKLKSEGSDLATRHSIRRGGTLILGQEQSSVGGLRFEASRAMVGELSQFNMWDRPLSHTELSALAHCSTGMLGNVVPWTSREVEVFGGVTKQPA